MSAIGSHPHGKAIAEEVALAIDIEFDFNLPVGCGERYARVDPAGLRGSIGGEADVLVSADDGVAAKVPPAALEVRVEVRLDQRMRAELCLRIRKSSGGIVAWDVIRGCSSHHPEHVPQLTTSPQRLQTKTKTAW